METLIGNETPVQYPTTSTTKVIEFPRDKQRRSRRAPIDNTPTPEPIPSFVRLSDTQRVGYSSIVEKLQQLESARRSFLVASLRELAQDPNSTTLRFNFDESNLGFTVTPIAPEPPKEG